MTEKKVEPVRQEEVRVIDRRSFTSDGDRRDPDASTDADSIVSPLASPSAGDSTDSPIAPPAAAEPRSEATKSAPASDDAVPSAHFQNLVLNLARQAAAHLGAGPSPLSGEVEVDLDAAQHIIDLLNAIELKTRGNLTQDEKEMIEGLIGDLQMQYVTVRSKEPKTS